MNELQWLVFIAVVVAYLVVGVFCVASNGDSLREKVFWFLLWIAWPVPVSLAITAIFK